jgi:hypothetical protein
MLGDNAHGINVMSMETIAAVCSNGPAIGAGAGHND